MESLIGSISIVFFSSLVIIGYWRIFEKAGKPGWTIFLPFYNLYSLLKIAGKSGPWMLFFLLPIINIITAPIAWIIMNASIARKFGETEWFGLGMAFFPYLFVPMLGLGDSTYEGVEPSTAAATVPVSDTYYFETEDGEYVEKIRLEDW